MAAGVPVVSVADHAGGVVSGTLLVFMAAIGYYITPALLGGASDQMLSSVIAFYALQTANWGMAGALGLILLAVTTVLYLVYGRLSRATMRIVQQNFAMVIGINTVGLILGAASGISVMMSALLHNMSTILVVANSLRLMVFPPMEGR